jgi:hypothetical protein
VTDSQGGQIVNSGGRSIKAETGVKLHTVGGTQLSRRDASP